MKGHPLTFSHASDPLEVDDWLRAVERQLDIAHCDDQEKVLFASGQLQGVAQDQWESYQYGRPNNAGQITWQEFMENFKTYHIPTGEVELKHDEFQALKQGSILVCEYHNWFTQLSRYALGEVDSDAKKQKFFLIGLNDEVQQVSSQEPCLSSPTITFMKTNTPTSEKGYDCGEIRHYENNYLEKFVGNNQGQNQP